MIQKLIQQIIVLLRESLTGSLEDSASHIVAGPIPPPATEMLPVIALYAGRMEVGRRAKDAGSSQPRPQEIRQEIIVDALNPQGPYVLSKTPLEKSVLCKVIFDNGALTERQIVLAEQRDFIVDYQNADILFSYDLSQADALILTYSFVGVFTIREFQQDFLIDVYDGASAGVEKWASLANAMILTSHDELIKNYNVTDKTEYLANQFISAHTIDRINLLAGIPDASQTVPKAQFTFQVQGQIKAVKEIVGGFGLITKIHSPGRISDQPVDIEVGLD